MKRLILATALALACTPALAATYSFTTNASQEAAVTDARTKYNASLPDICDSAQPPVCSPNPGARSTNALYVMFVLSQAVTSWDQQASVRPAFSPADKTALVAILTAAGSKGDATATALADKVQAAK